MINQRKNRPIVPASIIAVDTGLITNNNNVIVASGEVTLTWNRRNRLTQRKITKQSDADMLPEMSQTTRIRVYNNNTGALLHTETEIAGTSYSYTAQQEIAVTFSNTLANLRFEIESLRNSLVSFGKQIKLVNRS